MNVFTFADKIVIVLDRGELAFTLVITAIMIVCVSALLFAWGK